MPLTNSRVCVWSDMFVPPVYISVRLLGANVLFNIKERLRKCLGLVINVWAKTEHNNVNLLDKSKRMEENHFVLVDFVLDFFCVNLNTDLIKIFRPVER